ncbi:MAG: hypothetical protein K0B37_15150, partial [Bacteroidales bacterium]|nr:hypothetical protein [Bacteroidales bacterium]
MKKFYLQSGKFTINLILCVILLLINVHVFAQAPSVPSSNLSFSGIDGDRFYVSFTRGDGARRIIVASTSPITAEPVNGADYLAGSFGLGNELAPGQFVVYNGTASGTWINGLNHSTTYYFRIYEYNGTSFSTEYLISEYLEGSATTLTAPTDQASSLTFSNVTGNAMTVGWSKGNGAGRLLIARADSPVEVEPQDLTNYSAWAGVFGSTTTAYTIGTSEHKVLYMGTGTSASITGLDPNRIYHFAIFEYNGSNGKVYLRPGTKASQLTASTPTIAASNLSFRNIDGDRFIYDFTGGNGARRIVIAKEGSPVTAVPVDGASYTHNAIFGSGTEIAPDEFVVNNGTSTSSWLYGLKPGTTYHLAVFEYNGTGTETFYLTDPYLAGSRSTLFPPTDQAGPLTFSNITGNAMTVGWAKGNGSGRILVARADSPVEVEPQDLTNYSAWAGVFGSTTTAYTIGTSEHKVLYMGTGTSASITGLDPNRTYHFAIFEYNGSSGKLYLRPGSKASQITTSTPTTAASNLSYRSIDGDRFIYDFTGGNGARRIVIAKEGSPVTAVPEDGVSYTHSTTFGFGTEIETGEFVVNNGTSTSSWLYGLKPGTTYHLAVFEYNGTGTGTFYLTDPFLAGSRATFSHPTVQSSNAFTSSRSNTSINISWTRGNGSHRILIGRKDGPVNIEPQDLTNYNTTSGFGNSWAQIGTGNYGLYAGTGNNVNITNLEPGTNYYFALFEYNGSNARLYLRPGYQFALETFGERPLVQVSNAQFSNIDFTSFDVGFTKGDGTRRLVLAREGSPVIGGPADFISYNASNVFGQGDEIGTGSFVVYNDIGENFTLTGLESGKTYYFAFFEYTVSEQGELYKSPSYTSSQTTKSLVDLSISGILTPENGCNLSSAETVTIEISNLSSTTSPEFQVAYVLNDEEAVLESLTGNNSIAGNGKLVYSFSQTADLSAKGIYTLKAYVINESDTDRSNDTLSVVVEHIVDALTSVSPDVTVCAGENVLLQASGGVSYLWSNGSTQNVIQVNPVVSTNYSVMITTEQGCQVEKTIQVTVFEPGIVPVIAAQPADDACTGGMILSTQLESLVKWFQNIDGEFISLGESPTVQVIESGQYIASFTNENGCEIQSLPFLYEPLESPEIEVAGYATICSGESTILSVTGGNNILWSTGEAGESIVVSPDSDTKFWVEGLLENGCAFSDTVEITVAAQSPAVASQLTPANGSVNLAQPITLSWYPGEFSVAFDIYVWESGTQKPEFPVVSDLQGISHKLNFTEPGKTYNWQVVSKNSCLETE